jgi:dihydroflavonol-4-reductase
MKIAVTGATGFIGSNLCRRLRDEGHEVVAVVRDMKRAKRVLPDTLTVIEARLDDQDSLERAFDGCDGVMHTAALFNNPENTWDEYWDVNVKGVERVMCAARAAGVKRVVHCSTVGVAVGRCTPPYDENAPYNPPTWDKYETSKCEGEKLALQYAQDPNSPEVVVIRPAQVYGPGDRSKIKFYKLVKKRILIHPGKTLKHLVYVDDLCEAMLLAMLKDGINGEVFIIAGKEVTPLQELILTVGDALGVEKPKLYLPSTPMVLLAGGVEITFNALRRKPPIFRRSMDFFTRSVAFNCGKARNELGFQPKTSVQDGVLATARWYRQMDLI